MLKTGLACFALGIVAGLVAFTGGRSPAAEAIFVLAFVVGLVATLSRGPGGLDLARVGPRLRTLLRSGP